MTDTRTLKMDEPVEHSLLDDSPRGIVGQPVERIDGPLKVSGTATYSAEYGIDALHGALVTAPIASGTLTALDDTPALAMPGVLRVVHDFGAFLRTAQHGGEEEAPQQGIRRILYHGQPLAVVVAESPQAAREGTAAVAMDFAPTDAMSDFAERLPTAFAPEGGGSFTVKSEQGSLPDAMAGAEHTVDVTYTTPSQSSAAMEPHATIAEWVDGKLTLHSTMQMLASCRKQIADALDLDKEQVRILAPFVGGGFGSKLGITPEAVAASIAAREIGRPVRVVMTRGQVFTAVTRRSNSRQRVQLAADADGRLTGIGHDSVLSNLPGDSFFEPAGIATHSLYGGEARRVSHELVEMNLVLAGAMRAPGEAVGLLAIECAMDELAEAVGIDPIELRKRNEPERDPEKDVPFSSRKLTDCLDRGAELFGWDQRRAPGERREGEWLVGIGVAAAARTNYLQSSSARVSIMADGLAVVETDMTDIGTGSYTVLGQIAAELLGLPIERVRVRLGDTDFPPSAGSGGSWGAASSGSSVYLACAELRSKIAGKLGVADDALSFADGTVIADNRQHALGKVGGGMAAVGTIKPGSMDKRFNQASYGAHFAEVGVHAVTGEVRVRRMLGVFAAGRILNEATARSQCYGGMIFGIGAALMEDLHHDRRDGRPTNPNLAEYHVPVNADVGDLSVEFLYERDTAANPLAAKGLGELGICGAGASIANAVHNACGVRVRDFPLTCDKLLAGLPEL